MNNLATVRQSKHPTQTLPAKQQEEMEERARRAVLEVVSTYGYLADPSPEAGDNDMLAERRKKFLQNTKTALQTYREVIWTLSDIPHDIVQELGVPLEDISALIDFVDVTRCDKQPYSQEKCESHKRLLSKVKYIQYCIAKLRTRPAAFVSHRKAKITGEQMYTALYYAYIDETVQTQGEIIEIMGISKRTYYRWVSLGIEQLSEIMWGGSSPIINQMVDLFDCMTDLLKQKDTADLN